MYLNGSAELFYNNEKFLTGNFTRHINKLPTQENDLVHLEIGNSLMPVGINYLHKTSAPNVVGKIFVGVFIFTQLCLRFSGFVKQTFLR